MTYQGERARAMASEIGRVFEVSKVRVGADGHVSDVLWVEVGGKSDEAVGERVVAPAAEVVDAIHDGAQVAALFSSSTERLPERLFVIVKHEDGRECIAFEESPAPGRHLADMAKLDDAPRSVGRSMPRRMNTFAVSKVKLDANGRVIAVLWGKVNTRKNAWATPEVEAPVAEAVDALDAGDQVFALFPSAHGHLPDRRFVIADYEDGRKTIVLYGPAAYEREIHDMDRIDRATVI